MSQFLYVPVPPIPPRPPVLTLIGSSVRPGPASDPTSFTLGGEKLEGLPGDLVAEWARGVNDGMWTRGLQYAPESHAAALVSDPYNNTTVDLPALAAPLNTATVPAITGGTLAAATYHYQVTALNANGETTAIAAVAAVVGGTGAGSVKVTWQAVADAAQYRVYGRSGTLGLLATVGPFDDDQTPSYTDTGAATPGAVVPSSNTTAGPGSYTNLAIVQYVPPLLEVESLWSTFGFQEYDYKGRAIRLLENAKFQALEREFETGLLAQAAGYPNNYLSNSATVTDLTPGTVPSMTRALAILQEALATCGFGGQGMIHVQQQAAPNFLGARRVGQMLLDQFDNIIVPGVGYRGVVPGGNAPPSGQTCIYATDLVMTRDEPVTENDVYPNTFEEALDRGQAGSPNTLRFRAEKRAAAYFDGACQFCCRATLGS